MNIDDFLDRIYDIKKYNCSHFVAELWLHLTGEDISHLCQAFVGNGDEYLKKIRHRVKLRKPESPCVAMMTNKMLPPHAGIYLDGRIIHITEQGVIRADLCTILPFFKVSYFK